MHESNSFVTLTYNKEHLPEDGSLNPEHTRLWLYRFRKQFKKLSGEKFRYYLCGEYGDASFRPHYHLSMFGVGQEWKELIEWTWGKGFVQVSEFNELTAQYVAGYVVKKMTDKSDPRLDGKYPEFTRQSRCPGIGASAMEVIASAVCTDAGLDEMERVGDVPRRFNLGKKSFPLGRYLRNKLREEIGMSEKWKEDVKQAFFLEKSIEVQELLKASIKSGEVLSTSKLVARDKLQAIRNIEGRSKVYRKRSTL